jgi:hypothetical protein
MADRVRTRVLDILEHHDPLPVASEAEARIMQIVTQADERHNG